MKASHARKSRNSEETHVFLRSKLRSCSSAASLFASWLKTSNSTVKMAFGLFDATRLQHSGPRVSNLFWNLDVTLNRGNAVSLEWKLDNSIEFAVLIQSMGINVWYTSYWKWVTYLVCNSIGIEASQMHWTHFLTSVSEAIKSTCEKVPRPQCNKMLGAVKINCKGDRFSKSPRQEKHPVNDYWLVLPMFIIDIHGNIHRRCITSQRSTQLRPDLDHACAWA